MAVVMAGRMYAQAYPDRGLHPKNLSRAVKDSATVTGCLGYQKKRSGFSQMAEQIFKRITKHRPTSTSHLTR
jgi:hypothetical protein